MPTVTSRSRMPGDRPVGCHGGPGDISSGSGWLQAGQTVGAITIKPPSTSDLLSLYRRVFRPWPPENFSCGHGDEKGSSRQLLPGQNRLIWFWAIKMRSVLQGYSNPIRTLRMVGVPGFEPGASWTRRFGSKFSGRFRTHLLLFIPGGVAFPTSPLQCLRPLPPWSGSAFGSELKQPPAPHLNTAPSSSSGWPQRLSMSWLLPSNRVPGNSREVSPGTLSTKTAVPL